MEIFEIFAQPAAATEPTNGAFYNPAFRQNDEAIRLI